MAGHNPNDNQNQYFDNEYINFDQFLMQHNISNNATFYEEPSLRYPYNVGGSMRSNQLSHYSGHDYNGFYQPQMAAPKSDYSNADFVHNSNLLPTAVEFVPTSSGTHTNHNQSLHFNATEFVPKARFNKQYCEITGDSTDKKENINLLDKANSNVGDSGSNALNNNYKKKEDSSSAIDMVLNELEASHIADIAAPNQRIPNVAGGAIRKIKDVKQGNRDRNSAGE